MAIPTSSIVTGVGFEALIELAEAELAAARAALARTSGEDGLLEVPTVLRRLVREGALAPDAAGQVLDAMRDGVSLRRVRHRAPGRTDARPPARPIPQGSDPTRRPSG